MEARITRPPFLKHWQELESAEQVRPPAMDEPFGYVAEFADVVGIAHLRCAHIRLPPGVRSHPPIASRDEDGFFFVLEGAPDLWLDGHLYRLAEGDGVCLSARTGIAHALINNTKSDVRLFFLGEGMHVASRFGHPVDPAAAENLKVLGKLWSDAPLRQLGPHDGLADARRGARPPKGSIKKTKPGCVFHWRDILGKKAWHYPGSKEKHTTDASFGEAGRLARIGVRLQVLAPGHRTSWPHAERDEDEFVYLIGGSVEAWNDGELAAMRAGDFIGWPGATGIAHTIINNSAEDALVLVGGEASRRRGEIWYPFHDKRNKEIGARYWADHPAREFGPHDGMPDALRESLPAKGKKKKKSSKK